LAGSKTVAPLSVTSSLVQVATAFCAPVTYNLKVTAPMLVKFADGRFTTSVCGVSNTVPVAILDAKLSILERSIHDEIPSVAKCVNDNEVRVSAYPELGVTVN
jgi:hypothetical protein